MTDAAEPAETPQIYLITPPAFDVDTFGEGLARVLDGVDIACLRLSMAGRDAEMLARAADALREIAHARDVPIVMAEHLALVEPHGLDGVHLMGGRDVREARKALGIDPIVGTFCGTSRHAGMTAGEVGADYIAFGPVADDGLGGAVVERDLFAWWSEMIELPVVAEGALSREVVADLAPVVDFFAVGEEIWRQDDPLAALRELTAPLS